MGFLRNINSILVSLLVVILTLLGIGPIKTTMSQENNFDIVILNTHLIDGTGAPWYNADLGIVGNIITAIGKFSAEDIEAAGVVVDGEGSFLTPGFIDSHTHDDVAIIADPAHSSKTLQGVTTLVTGNCGFTNYPNGDINEEVQTHLRSLLGEVDSSHFFRNFSAYKNKLTENSIGLNVASLVGHGPLRISVMGYAHREATQAEIEEMASLLEEQLLQGAIGMSLGLMYAPSAYAGTEELISLARVIAKHDRLLSAHIRTYEGNLLESIEEFLLVLKESGAKGLLSHLQAAGRPYWEVLIPRALEMLEAARNEEGIDIAVDMYPYVAGSSTILQLLPPSAMAGGINDLLNKLGDAEYREQLKELTESGREPGWESKIALIGYENVIISSAIDPQLKQYEGMSIPEAAAILHMTEFQVVLYAVVTDEGKTNVIMFQQSEVDLNKVLSSRLHMIGSDSIPRAGGKPHPRMYGSFPRVIGRLARQDGLMLLEEAVRKATSFTAQRFGIQDRGILRPGMVADLVLFSNDFLDKATFDDPTLTPKGIQGVWVNGVRIVENGEVIEGKRPGVVISK